SLRVFIDTQKPVVILRPLPSRSGEVGVAWDVRDDNLDLSSPDAFKLEYRVNNPAWQPLYVNPLASQHYSNPMHNGVVEFRLRAVDRAGHVGEAAPSVSLNAGGGNSATITDGGAARANPNLPPVGDPSIRMVNSKRISLNYEIKEKGPSGVSK